MKKIIAIAAAAAIMSGMLQSVYADTGFDIVSASCNDSGEIVVTFNGTPAQNNEAVYFVDGDGIKTYSTPTIEDNSLKIAFPNELLGKNTKLVVSGDTVSQDNVQIEQAYVYPVVADNITESFNSDCDWVYLDTSCLSQGTETINNSYTVTTAGQLDKHSVGEKMNHIILPMLDYKSFSAKSYTMQYTAKAVNDASTATAFVNLGGIKRITRGSFSVLGYGVGINKGNLVLKRFENVNSTSDTIQNGLEADYRTALLNDGYTNGTYMIKLEVNSTDDEFTIKAYTAPIDASGTTGTFDGPFVYTDDAPVSTSGSFGFSAWAVNDYDWAIDEVSYETGIRLGEAVTSGQLIEKANGIIAEVLALTTTENLAEKTAQLNEVISELSIFGMNENDIPTYQDYLDKCDLLQRFDVADVSPSKVDAQYLTVSFTRPVDASKINDCIYLALDDRTKLDAEISVNTSKANEINIKLPVKFADRYANLVITPDFQSADGIKIHTGRCVRMKFTKAYTDCINEEEFTKDFVPYSTTGSTTLYKDTSVRATEYTFTEEGLTSGGTWFARDKDWAAENMVIEVLYKSAHAQPHGLNLLARLDGLYTNQWTWFVNDGYAARWWYPTGWINDMTSKPGDDDDTDDSIDEYGYDQAVAAGGGKASSFKLEPNQWYRIRMVLTTLENGDVKVELNAVEDGKDSPKTTQFTYTDTTTPLAKPGLFMIINGDTNNTIGYIVCTSAPVIEKIYSIDEIKALANEMSEGLDASTVDSSKREEVQYLSNTMAFLQNMGVDISELAGYANYTELGKIFPSMTSCKVTDDISNYYFDFEMTHPVKPEFVNKSSFTVLKGSSAVEEYDVSLLNEKTLRVTLYNDRTYSGKYKITASKNIENTHGLNIGKDFVCEYTEKAPLSLSEPVVSESDGKINVQFDITGDDTTEAKSYVVFTLLLQHETKADGKVYTKTVDKNIVSGTLLSAGEKNTISFEFNKPEGEYEIYTTVLKDLNSIKQIYKSYTVKSN